MSLLSPQANLYNGLLARLADQVPDLRFISLDMGQLEIHNGRPAVSWPCCLVDFAATKYSDMQNNTTQMAEGVVLLRIGLVAYTEPNNLTPDGWREKALQFYETEQQVYLALHGWAPTGFGRLMRRSASTEQRDDDIRVRVMEFSYSYTDETAAPVKFTIPRPDAVELI